MANMIPISTVTVGSGGAATISFTGIPQTYTDLVLKISARSSASSERANTNLTFNGSTSGYTGKLLVGTGSSAGSYNLSSSSQFDWGAQVPAATATANGFSNAEIYIPNYTSANYKSFSVDDIYENNATSAEAQLVSGLWSNTSPISSILLSCASGSYTQYSTATLYGIRKY